MVALPVRLGLLARFPDTCRGVLDLILTLVVPDFFPQSRRDPIPTPPTGSCHIQLRQSSSDHIQHSSGNRPPRAQAKLRSALCPVGGGPRSTAFQPKWAPIGLTISHCGA